MKPWIHSVRREILCRPCLCLTGGLRAPRPLSCSAPALGVGWGGSWGCNLSGASSWGSPQLTPHWRSCPVSQEPQAINAKYGLTKAAFEWESWVELSQPVNFRFLSSSPINQKTVGGREGQKRFIFRFCKKIKSNQKNLSHADTLHARFEPEANFCGHVISLFKMVTDPWLFALNYTDKRHFIALEPGRSTGWFLPGRPLWNHVSPAVHTPRRLTRLECDGGGDLWAGDRGGF